VIPRDHFLIERFPAGFRLLRGRVDASLQPIELAVALV